MIYSKIYNPLSNRFVNIDSKLGREILRQYIGQMGGDAKSRTSWKKLKITNIQTNLLSKLKSSLSTANFEPFINNDFKIIDFDLKEKHQKIKTDLWYPLCQRNFEAYKDMTTNIKNINFFNGHNLKISKKNNLKKMLRFDFSDHFHTQIYYIFQANDLYTKLLKVFIDKLFNSGIASTCPNIFTITLREPTSDCIAITSNKENDKQAIVGEWIHPFTIKMILKVGLVVFTKKKNLQYV